MAARCAKGVRSETGAKAVCCPASCGTCDGRGCSGRPGGPRHCCGLAIWKGGRPCVHAEDTLCILGGEKTRAFAPHAWGICLPHYRLPHGQYIQVANRKMYCPAGPAAA